MKIIWNMSEWNYIEKNLWILYQSSMEKIIEYWIRGSTDNVYIHMGKYIHFKSRAIKLSQHPINNAWNSTNKLEYVITSHLVPLTCKLTISWGECEKLPGREMSVLQYYQGYLLRIPVNKSMHDAFSHSLIQTGHVYSYCRVHVHGF